MGRMSAADKPFLTRFEWFSGVHYIFASLERPLSDGECESLGEKYFETHKRMTLPGQVLFVDLRPAFRKPLTDVEPQFCAVSKNATPHA
jgi:hypothetical protein